MTARTMFAAVLVSACASPRPWGAATMVPSPPARTVTIEVSNHGFSTTQVPVHVGEVVTLVFDRTTEHTCAKRVVLSLDADRRVERDLPVGTPVAITLRFDHPGELGYSCSMGMYGGVIDVAP